MFHALLLKSKTQIQESICKKKSTLWLTNASIQCSQNQVINGSYLSQRWKILLASNATTFAHRRTSSSNTYWLIQAKSRLNVHTATFLVQASKLKTHKLTHSGEELFICIQCNFSCTQTDNQKETHEDPHWRENTQVCSVWLFFHSLSEAGKSHAVPYSRCVINVLIPVLSLKIWKYTIANTQERNLSTVTNVIILVL